MSRSGTIRKMPEPPVPALVISAVAEARRVGFPLTHDEGIPSCSLPDAGRVLAVLAAGSRRIGEVGTGVGYGAAWMASAMPPDATLVTVEADPGRAAVAAGLFAGDARVQVVQGDGEEVLAAHAPFDLLFLDGGSFGRDPVAFGRMVDRLVLGGRVVVDDVTPRGAGSPHDRFRASDPKREAFFGDDRLCAAEIVLPTLGDSVLVAARVR